MPLRIITGTPGAGKTAMAVADLMSDEFKGRPLFVMGIPGLKLDHVPVPPVAEWTRLVPNKDDPTLLEPEYTFPPESIIVIDEAQRVFRPRASASKVPDHVAAMEKHRHGGIEIWCLTQNPRLLDSNIRDLCTCYIHLRNTALGRWRYEWPEIADPKSKSDREISSNRRYKLPKHAFAQYTSAKLHIKQSLSVPNAVKILMVVFVALAFLGYYGYGRYTQVKKEMSGEKSLEGQTKSPSPVGPSPSAPADLEKLYLASYQPRLSAFEHTAPVYDGLTKPVTVPVPSACIATKSKCLCYTAQATKYAVDDSLCRQIVESGIYLPFDPSGPASRNSHQQGVQRPYQDQLSRVDRSPVERPTLRGLPESDLYVGIKAGPPVLSYDRQYSGAVQSDTVAAPVVQQAQGIGRGRVVQ